MFALVIFEHRNRIKRNDESIGTLSNTQKRNQSRRGNLRSMYMYHLELSTSLITGDDFYFYNTRIKCKRRVSDERVRLG